MKKPLFFNQKIGARITSFIVLGLLISFISVITLQFSGERQRILDTFIQGQKNVTLLLAENMVPAVRFGREKVIEQSYSGLIRDEGELLNHIKVYDASGETLAHFDKDIAETITFSDVDLIYWLKNSPQLIQKDSDKEVGFLAPVRRGPQSVGAIIILWSKEPILEEIRASLLQQFFIIIVLIGLVAICVLFLLNHSILKPLSQLTTLMGQVSKGKYGNEIPHVDQNDEVGDIAKSLEVFRCNSMELDRLRQSLEEEVLAKTKELRIEKEKVEETNLALAKSQERYDLAVKGASVGIWDWDLVNGSIYWSDKLKDIMRIPKKTFILDTKYFRSRIHPTEREKYKTVVDRHLRMGQSFDIECRVLRADETYTWLRVRGEAMRKDDGTVIRTAGSIEDISEKKHAETVMREKQKREALGDLASGVAHEINNLLQLPVMAKDMVLPHIDQENHTVREFVEKASDSAIKARLIVADILKFSRGEDTESEKEVLDFLSTVKGTLAFLEGVIPNTIHLKMIAPDNLHKKIIANSNEFAQVLTNLVSNAAYAMKEQGEITVTLDARNLEGIEAKSHGLSNGEYCILEVIDTGTGIPKDKLERIFNPLFTTKPVGEGTGLGLSVAWGIIKDFNGHILVDSTLNKGTTFTILIPTYEKQEQTQKGKRYG